MALFVLLLLFFSRHLSMMISTMAAICSPGWKENSENCRCNVDFTIKRLAVVIFQHRQRWGTVCESRTRRNSCVSLAENEKIRFSYPLLFGVTAIFEMGPMKDCLGCRLLSEVCTKNCVVLYIFYFLRSCEGSYQCAVKWNITNKWVSETPYDWL